MSQINYSIADAPGAAFLANLNSVLDAIGTTNKGPNRPSTIGAGMIWLDDNSPSSTTWTLNLYDGSDDIPLGTFDTVNNKFSPANASTTITTVRRQVLKVGGIYLPSPGMLFCDAAVQGAGGGGGGTTSGAAGGAAAACGGGGGGYARKLFTAAQVAAAGTINYTVGAGGVGANGISATTGGTGGNSTFLGVTGNGGGGGGGDSPKAANDRSNENNGGGGAASGGDVNIPGEAGSWGIVFGPRGTAISGKGGNSFLGMGGDAVHEIVVGVAGRGYGSGGSGGASTTNAARGGDGAPGLITLTELCSQ